MKKALLIVVLGFVAGFLTHALFFPDVLANGISDITQVVLPLPTPTQAAGGTQSSFITTITYDGTRFNRHNITIDVGNYLIIVNGAKQNLMWLVSNDPNLATTRGYGDSEQVKERMDTKGQFVVEDKNNPQEKVLITVK